MSDKEVGAVDLNDTPALDYLEAVEGIISDDDNDVNDNAASSVAVSDEDDNEHDDKQKSLDVVNEPTTETEPSMETPINADSETIDSSSDIDPPVIDKVVASTEVTNSQIVNPDEEQADNMKEMSGNTSDSQLQVESQLENIPVKIVPEQGDVEEEKTIDFVADDLVSIVPEPVALDDIPPSPVTDDDDDDISISAYATTTDLTAGVGTQNDDDDDIEAVRPPLPERRESFNSVKTDQSNSAKSFKSWFNIKLRSANTSKEDVSDITSINDTVTEVLKHEENFDFIVSRLHHNDERIKSRSSRDKEMYIAGKATIRNTFNEIKEGIHGANNDELISKIDWEFWSMVVNNYSGIVANQPEELAKRIGNGIPNELRGMIWQLIANSKSSSLEEFFNSLKKESSDYERAIKRDLSRTRFMNNEKVRNKADEVYNIIKAYSIYDSEVGYTQGMAFITVPLLMNMSESESFCLLCSLMKSYDFRSLYLPEMPGLVLKLYQFDRLLEDLCPQLYNHLIRQGIRSSMYATQWFLTLFGYKFPLEIVLRIYDIVIAEGLETILKFAVNLMIQNKDHLIKLPFDDLLKFLKDNLFYFYLIGSSEDVVREITVESYRLDDLVNDSMSIKISPITLKKYELEFEEIHRLEKEREEEIESLRSKNGLLTRNIRKLETSYSLLNKEHVEIANEMVQGKMKIANLEDENKHLHEKIEDLTEKLAKLTDQYQAQETVGDKNESVTTTNNDDDDNTTNNSSNNTQLQKDIDLEIAKTMQRNSEVMEMNRLLEEQLGELEHNYDTLSREYKSIESEHHNLKSRLRNLMG